MKKYRLFIIDDHKIVRDGLKVMLLSKPEIVVCGEAGSIAESRQKLESLEIDLLFVDLKLPDGNGGHLLEEVLADSPHIKAALLTADPSRPDLERAQNAGVLAFLTKDIDRDEYFLAIDKMLAGKRHVSSAFAEVLMGDRTVLTPREQDILVGFSEGLTYKEIGARLEISPRTVETHKLHLLEKFGVKSIVEMVRIAIREGHINP